MLFSDIKKLLFSIFYIQFPSNKKACVAVHIHQNHFFGFIFNDVEKTVTTINSLEAIDGTELYSVVEKKLR